MALVDCKSSSGQLSIDEAISVCQSVSSGNQRTLCWFMLPQWHSSTSKTTVVKNRRLLEDKVLGNLIYKLDKFLSIVLHVWFPFSFREAVWGFQHKAWSPGNSSIHRTKHDLPPKLLNISPGIIAPCSGLWTCMRWQSTLLIRHTKETEGRNHNNVPLGVCLTKFWIPVTPNIISLAKIPRGLQTGNHQRKAPAPPRHGEYGCSAQFPFVVKVKSTSWKYQQHRAQQGEWVTEPWAGETPCSPLEGAFHEYIAIFLWFRYLVVDYFLQDPKFINTAWTPGPTAWSRSNKEHSAPTLGWNGIGIALWTTFGGRLVAIEVPCFGETFLLATWFPL